jgi:hypothetical protein
MNDIEKKVFNEVSKQLKLDALAFAELAEQCKNNIETIEKRLTKVLEMLN